MISVIPFSDYAEISSSTSNQAVGSSCSFVVSMNPSPYAVQTNTNHFSLKINKYSLVSPTMVEILWLVGMYNAFYAKKM